MPVDFEDLYDHMGVLAIIPWVCLMIMEGVCTVEIWVEDLVDKFRKGR